MHIFSFPSSYLSFFIRTLIFKGWHLNCWHTSRWPGFQAPWNVQSELFQKISCIYCLFKAISPNENWDPAN
jgi:hypothetical protein